MRLAVVTGATGFIGPHVVRALLDTFSGCQFRCVVRETSRTDEIRHARVSLAVADLRDPAALGAAFQGADTLINLASLGFDWTDNVILSAQRSGIRRAIFISTTAILTALPVASKPVRLRAEELVKGSGLAWTILRPTMIYGTPKDRNIARLIRFVDKSPIVPLLAPHALQQPIHVDDVAAAVIGAAAADGTVHKVYNISGAAPLTMEALAREIAGALGKRRLFVPVALTPLVKILSLWERVGRPPIRSEQVRRIQENKSFDYRDAATDFGFAPRDFRAGVQTEIALIRQAV
jgi:uncharacterized protein YbjT (DUF2867 family)